jgi:hypothetical protein
MIKRSLKSDLEKNFKNYPIISVNGPRQSGKTTLVKECFPNASYVNLESPDSRSFAIDDPKNFLSNYSDRPLIIDEVQRVPELFSYIQAISDERGSSGQFILTGSHNILLHQGISQSLAGRVALFTLFPLEISELGKDYQRKTLDEQLLYGFYPRIYDKNLDPVKWYNDYVETYLEKDVRELKNISDLHQFYKFLQLCAGRTGQILNTDALASSVGVSHNTIVSWLSLLEASYIIFFLQPYYRNFNKRLTKSPKIHFYDSGLVCSLLNIKTTEQLFVHPLKGSIFESYVISEVVKNFYHHAEKPVIYYWLDKSQREIDFLIENGQDISLIEVKSGETFASDYFKNINYWREISGMDKNVHSYVVYGGSETQKRKDGQVLAWDDIIKLQYQ